MQRCDWCLKDPIYIKYHDTEWGVPVHDDNKIFEFLILEGAQAGLSWLTILKRREGYRKAFADFDPAQVARFTPERRPASEQGHHPQQAQGGIRREQRPGVFGHPDQVRVF
jgi:3-methyladenine DNA glycosylase Tag